MSKKLTSNTLQLTVIENPRRKVTVQIAFEKTEFGRRPKYSKYSPRPSLTSMQIQCQPGMCEGSVLQTNRRGMEGRVSTLNTPSKFLN